MRTYLLFFAAFILLLSSCDIDDSGESYNKATGNIDEIVVIMDGEHWQGEIGDTVRHFLTQRYPQVPQNESIFDVRYLKPEGFSGILKAARNVVIVCPIGRFKSYKVASEIFDPKQIDVKNNIIGKRDVYAEEQQILYVYGKDNQSIIDYFVKNNQGIIKLISDNEKKKLNRTVYLAGYDKVLSDKIDQKFNCSFRIPSGYKIAKEEDNFSWLRYDHEKYTANIFMKSIPYNGKVEEDSELGVKQRDILGKAHVEGSAENSYMMTEDKFAYDQTLLNVNNKEVIESRGLWKMSRNFLGGPFINYVIDDPKNKRVVVLDAFVMAPASKKRQIMRQLEFTLQQVKLN